MNQPKKTLPKNIPVIRLDTRSLTLPLLHPQTHNADMTFRLLQNIRALEEGLAASRVQLSNKQKEIQTITRSFAKQLRFGSSTKSTKEMAVQVSNQNFQFKTCIQQFLQEIKNKYRANLDYPSLDIRKIADCSSQTDSWLSLKEQQNLSQSIQTISLVSNHQWQLECKKQDLVFFKKAALEICQLQRIQLSDWSKMGKSVLEHCFDQTIASKKRSAWECETLAGVETESGRRRQRVKTVECQVTPQVRKKPYLFHHRILQSQIIFCVKKLQSPSQTECSVKDFAVQSEPSFPPAALHLELSQEELPDSAQISTLPISATFGEVKSEKSVYNRSEFEEREVRNEFVDIMQRNARRRQERFRQRAQQSPLSDLQPQEINQGHQHVYFCGNQAHLRPSDRGKVEIRIRGSPRQDEREVPERMEMFIYQQAKRDQLNSKPFFPNHRLQNETIQNSRNITRDRTTIRQNSPLPFRPSFKLSRPISVDPESLRVQDWIL